MKRSKQLKKQRRKFDIRSKIMGTSERPRLAVFRSNSHIYAQIIDDTKGVTLASASDLTVGKGVEKSSSSVNTKKERAYQVGQDLATKAAKSGVKKVVFDRGGNLYHGRIAELARGARDGGLEF